MVPPVVKMNEKIQNNIDSKKPNKAVASENFMIFSVFVRILVRERKVIPGKLHCGLQ